MTAMENNENTNEQPLHGNSIIREINYFLNNETSSICGEQDFFEELYKEDIENYNMGVIWAEDIQIDNLRHIKIDGDYVVVEFWHPTMLISPEDDEDFLVENWAKIRRLFLKRGWTDDMDSLRERRLGIKNLSTSAYLYARTKKCRNIYARRYSKKETLSIYL